MCLQTSLACLRRFLSSHLDCKAQRHGEVAGKSDVELQAEGVGAADPQLLRFLVEITRAFSCGLA